MLGPPISLDEAKASLREGTEHRLQSKDGFDGPVEVASHPSVAPSSPVLSDLLTPAPWSKVLWRSQPYPDNYVDDTFLGDMSVNTTAQFPDMFALMLSSFSLAQQLAAVFLFIAIFVHVLQGRWSAPAIIWTSAGISLCLAVLAEASPSAQGLSALRNAPGLVVLVATLYVLAPMVRTFNEATTDDSIWACTAILFIGHVALADYAMDTPASTSLSATASLTMAMCASVVLASRLTADMDVFALLLLALQTFALYPLLRQRLYRRSGLGMSPSSAQIPRAAAPLTLALVAASIWAFLSVSPLVALVVEPGSLLFVCVLCPWWMHRAQRWKTEIRGPWDEAIFVTSLKA